MASSLARINGRHEVAVRMRYGITQRYGEGQILHRLWFVVVVLCLEIDGAYGE